MKKIIGVALAVLILCFSCASAFAVPLSAGTTKLNSTFLNGDCPGELDYVYYSPVKSDADTTKYPILVWLHGKGSGLARRSQLNNYEFSNWASDEYQARFESTGGCYLLAVRASTASDNSWDSGMCGSLKATIDHFISRNSDNIDMNRVYIAGYSTGGTMVWDMVSKYPSFFAAAMPLASIFQPSVVSLSQLSSVAVWVFSSDNDYYQLSETSDVKPIFNALKRNTNDLSSIRHTYFSEAVFADGTKKMNGQKVAEEAEHFIWESFTYDMHMADGKTVYLYSTTVDGYGNEIDFSDGTGIITWLDKQVRSDEAGSNSTNLSFFIRIALFFRKIIMFFQGLFG